MLEIPKKVGSSVCIGFAVGCTRNEADTALMFAYFRANGWRLRRRIEDANLVLVATCGFDTWTQERSMKLLSIADDKRKAGSTLVVIGCLAGINESLIHSNFNAITIPPAELDKLDDVIGASVKLHEIRESSYLDPCMSTARYCFSYAEWCTDTSGMTAYMKDMKARIHSGLIRLRIEKPAQSVVWNIKRILRCKRRPEEPFANFYRLRIAHGCLGTCSYCAIRSAIGSLRSVPLDKVLREFRTALGKAFREFQLVAGDTGAYGQDIGSNVVGLLRALFAQEGKFRLTIMDFNPEWLIAYSDQLIAMFAEQTHKMRFISIPIQSGSDRILRLMRRRYTASQATECLCRLKEDCPEMYLNIHVMVGFPTETDEDFDRTIQLLRRVRFDRIEIFRYCDRPNTATSLMNDKVSRETIEGRVSRLRNEFPH